MQQGADPEFKICENSDVDATFNGIAARKKVVSAEIQAQTFELNSSKI